MKLAIVGAGISGSLLARELRDKFQLQVFEKSRGPGGRMATRRANDFSWFADHGAQFFTLRNEEIHNWLIHLGLAKQFEKWKARVVLFDSRGNYVNSPFREDHYVAIPSMNSLCKTALDGVDVSYNSRVQKIRRTQTNSWELLSDQEKCLGEFDWVIFSAPIPQTKELISEDYIDIELFKQCEMEPCYAIFGEVEIHPDWDAAYFQEGNVRWMASNNSKPGREGRRIYVAHSSAEFANSIQNLDETERMVRFQSEVFQSSNVKFLDSYSYGHYWRYARAKRGMGKEFSIDAENQLAAVSDCFVGERVEGAMRSSYSLSRHLRKFL